MTPFFENPNKKKQQEEANKSTYISLSNYKKLSSFQKPTSQQEDHLLFKLPSRELTYPSPRQF